jgi:hypothetical protein
MGATVRDGGKTAVFHVGAHKTGTTLVQQYLLSNRESLARRGVRHVSRAELSPAIGWGEVLRREPAQLAEHLTSFRTNPWYRVFVASHENIIGHPFIRGGRSLYPDADANAAALANVLKPFRAKVVLTVRPQHELLESYYLQSINLGGHDSFGKWLARIDLDAISWQPVIDQLHDRFGANGVEVVDFAVIQQGQEHFLRHVLCRMHARLDRDVTYTRMRNPGLSGKGLSMALAARPYLHTPEERALVRSFLQRHFSNAQHPRPVLLTDRQRVELNERYDGEYAALVGQGIAQ